MPNVLVARESLLYGDDGLWEDKEAPPETGPYKSCTIITTDGTTLLGADDKVLRPAILWNDGRSFVECAELEAAIARMADEIRPAYADGEVPLYITVMNGGLPFAAQLAGLTEAPVVERDATDRELRVDANCGWTVKHTIQMLPVLEEFGVTVLEQPLDPRVKARADQAQREGQRGAGPERHQRLPRRRFIQMMVGLGLSAPMAAQLLGGTAVGLVEAAARWAERYGLWLDVRSKSERGQHLQRGDDSARVSA